MRSVLLFSICALFLLGCNQTSKKKLTANGYEYMLHTSGKGEKPAPGDYAYFHAQLRNGDTVLYSSRDQPQMPFIQIPLEEVTNRKTSPVEDILREMTLGDSATVLINLDTIPAEMRPRGFEKASVMFYDVVLLDIKTQEEYNTEAQRLQEEQMKAMELAQARQAEVATMVGQTLEQFKNGALKNQLTESETGLKYIVHEKKDGPKLQMGDMANVHYYGVLMDGTMFDNSFERGQPISFPLGQGRVIKGWDEGLSYLKRGEKATFFIPYNLAYGEQGSPPTIPAKSDLVFYVEVVE
ncbi:MAG TPA: FKBP-type peptidyl-prolyl cis-trans isomerase [Saprospiraceae bacterium]|nr:FKBP-type peptidyl-prolyl cis-trans isomerase [Saprospiraceae bacterium]HMQ81367.1 FKBP-type peptidyl-prolyl cis-trans isomerase [Saprospiraceae bacterium]